MLNNNYNNYYMYKEIHEQVSVLPLAIKKNHKYFQEIAETVRVRNIKEIVLVARGSSEHACLIAKYFAEIHTKIGRASCRERV